MKSGWSQTVLAVKAMTRILARWILFYQLVSGPVFAQDVPSIKQFLPQHCHYVAQFEQSRTLAALPIPLVSKGRLLHDCDRGLIWRTEIPIVESLVYSSSNRYFRIATEDKATELNGIIQGQIAMVMSALMQGNIKLLKQRFSLTITDSEARRTLVLTPVQQIVQEFIHRVRLDRSEEDVVISLDFQSGDNTTISIAEPRALDRLDYTQCQTLLEQIDQACTALFSPLVFADSLTEPEG